MKSIAKRKIRKRKSTLIQNNKRLNANLYQMNITNDDYNAEILHQIKVETVLLS